MYPVIVAHANDHSDTGSAIQVSGGLLLVFGLGSIVGPSLAGFAMSGFSAQWLFAVTGSAHVLLVLFALLRIWMAPPVRAEDKVAFQATPLGRGSTPETVTMAAESLEMLEQDASQTQSSPAGKCSHSVDGVVFDGAALTGQDCTLAHSFRKRK